MSDIDLARMRADAGAALSYLTTENWLPLGGAQSLARHVLALCDRVEALEAQLAEHQRLTTEAESETAE